MVGYIDLDGTLLDTRAALFESYSDAAAAYDISIDQDLFNQKCFGNRAEDFLLNFTADIRIIQAIKASKRLNYEKHFGKIKINQELLSQIFTAQHSKNYIFTNVESKVALNLLEVFGLKKHFPHVISIDQFKIPKPSRESIDYALTFLENDDAAIFYDDNEDLIKRVTDRGLHVVLIKISNS